MSFILAFSAEIPISLVRRFHVCAEDGTSALDLADFFRVVCFIPQQTVERVSVRKLLRGFDVNTLFRHRVDNEDRFIISAQRIASSVDGRERLAKRNSAGG